MDLRWRPRALASQGPVRPAQFGVANGGELATNFGWAQDSCLKLHRIKLNEQSRRPVFIGARRFIFGIPSGMLKGSIELRWLSNAVGGNCFLRAVDVLSAIDDVGGS
jgi:hypothetical protein